MSLFRQKAIETTDLWPVGPATEPSTDEELPVAVAFIAMQKVKLASLDHDIEAALQLLGDLRARREALCNRIAAQKAYVALVRRLPDDILREIFVRCLPMNSNPSIMTPHLGPTLLTHLCSRWRNLSHSTPELWARLCITFRPGAGQSEPKYSERSGSKYEDIEAVETLKGTCDYGHELNDALGVLGRCRALTTFAMRVKSGWHQSQILDPPHSMVSTPQLRILRLCLPTIGLKRLLPVLEASSLEELMVTQRLARFDNHQISPNIFSDELFHFLSRSCLDSNIKERRLAINSIHHDRDTFYRLLEILPGVERLAFEELPEEHPYKYVHHSDDSFLLHLAGLTSIILLPKLRFFCCRARSNFSVNVFSQFIRRKCLPQQPSPGRDLSRLQELELGTRLVANYHFFNPQLEKWFANIQSHYVNDSTPQPPDVRMESVVEILEPCRRDGLVVTFEGYERNHWKDWETSWLQK
ncbi:hypothetical protein D9619_007921 [Psilocybe cf. subviscida]|uniref:F-box domain-containing protein n=1 Tax=Psilocybe cf. subviscida TaxID=2480587 RepID=A0A8H5AUA0_9AGAR|nr:hypothetical protein D9619_007921 [Psilocybe cf. subviscida]